MFSVLMGLNMKPIPIRILLFDVPIQLEIGLKDVRKKRVTILFCKIIWIYRYIFLIFSGSFLCLYICCCIPYK